jgi:uncharacterized protein YyaL (SSP411 family)
VPNRLAEERSPYLLQHANNPVDWYAWGEAAFQRARELDRPIFLSIGYSTCHWCHVMEHESFEDPTIAELLNREFVSIKVDREERPDVDRVYMTFVQATTGAGGWPMTVFLTPDLQPFFGGTYFPPSSRWGRPGFPDLLTELARAWREERARIDESAAQIVDRLRATSGSDDAAPDRGPVAGPDAVRDGVAIFAQSFDSRHGGFGGAPKFPRPSDLLFLLEARALTAQHEALQMTLDTLRAMATGGIHDHVGGGFHRYSVDAEWRVPHFEKMLYDQAQLVLAFLEAAQASGDRFYASVAEDTLDYVTREMTSPEGGFYSAEDADSLPPSAEPPAPNAERPVPSAERPVPSAERPVANAEPREGAFYIWTAAEIDQLLGADAVVVKRRFGVEAGGNAPSDPQGEFKDQNILYVAQSVEEVAVRSGRSIDDVMTVLARARGTLFQARSRRPRPHLDDKVITAWNGLMIAACARAARVLVDSPRRQDWRRAAERAARMVEAYLWRAADRRLLRRYRDGDARVDAFCEDYACLAWGLIELFQTTGDGHWLAWALELADVQTALFWDERDGGWFSTTGQDPAVLLRMKEDYDGAEPAASSVTVRNLLTLAYLVSEPALLARARRTLERYGPHLGRAARVMPFMLANVATINSTSAQVVIIGATGSADTMALERVVAKKRLPACVQITLPESGAAGELAARLPWTSAMGMLDGRATAYFCRDFVCQAPVTDPDALERQLNKIEGGGRVVL